MSIALLSDGVQIARETTNFEVSKAGFEQVLYQSARERPWTYGLLTSAMALMMGWLASVIFRATDRVSPRATGQGRVRAVIAVPANTDEGPRMTRAADDPRAIPSDALLLGAAGVLPSRPSPLRRCSGWTGATACPAACSGRRWWATAR